MRIAILTVYFADYGSFGHATALYKYLENLGHDVYFVNESIRYPVSKRLKYANIFFKFMPEFVLKLAKNYNSMLTNYYYLRRELKHYKIANPNLDMEDICNDCDCIIVGGDELWSLTNGNMLLIPQYFGVGFADKKMVISFGTSGLTLENPKENLNDDIVTSLKSFKKIMVRDTVTQKWLGDYVGVNAELVLDPALFNPYYAVKKAEREENSSDYILIYGEHFNDEQINSIRHFAKEKQKKLVSVIWKTKWSDEHIVVESMQQLQELFKNSYYVITGTFHGTIFSLVNQKQFMCFMSALRGGKIEELLNQIGLPERMYRAGGEILSDRIEYNLVNSKLEKMRRRTKEIFEDELLSIEKQLQY